MSKNDSHPNHHLGRRPDSASRFCRDALPRHNSHSHHDTALRMALQREQSRIRMPEGLTERVMNRVTNDELRVTNEESRFARRSARRDVPHLGNEGSKLLPFSLSIAAILIAGLFILVPRLNDSRSLAIYEGSYVIENGQRSDNLKDIKADISEALSMAEQAELLSRE